MKLAISNIAWQKENDNEMYQFLFDNGFTGLEIAPTRLIEDKPYEHLNQAKDICKELKNIYHLEIVSMQSIWFGREEKLFNTIEERKFLLEYTKKAILFAQTIQCPNLVFGSPKNRCISNMSDLVIAKDFFREIGEYAMEHDTVVSIEANPTIYNTNFINTTQEAFDFVKEINCQGLKVNVDLGTMIVESSSINILIKNIDWINHIHISEPYLAAIEPRIIHKQLKELQYDKYFSIEMSNKSTIEEVKNAMLYIKGVFE